MIGPVGVGAGAAVDELKVVPDIDDIESDAEPVTVGTAEDAEASEELY